MSGNRYSVITETEAETLLKSRLYELERLQQIESLTSQMNDVLNTLHEEIENLQLGTNAVAKITTNWIQIIRAVSLAANSLMVYNENDFKKGIPTTERLVRCALDDIGVIVNQLKEDNKKNNPQ